MGGNQSKPEPKYWSVENNNFMNNSGIKGLSGEHYDGVLITGNDPARGCSKNFVSSYYCGNNKTNIKTINIDPSASGKVAVFDCEDEQIRCTGGTLFIEDDGNATMKDEGGNTVWQSNTNKTGLSLPKYSAAKTKYKRNFMNTGEFLRINEIVGSPSGNCYLQCGSWGGKVNLLIGYQVLACNEPGKEPDPKSYGEYGYISNSHGATYKMQQGVQNHNLQGSIGYSDNNMEAHKYPKSLVTLGTDYFNMGNYNTQSTNIKVLENTGLDDCKSACNEYGNCHGFVLGDKCNLKGEDNYPMNLKRIPDNNAELYVRKMKVSNNESCSKNVIATYGQTYANMPQGSNMTQDTLCQLGEATSAQLKVVAEKEEELKKHMSSIGGDIKSLNSQSSILDTKMLKALKHMEKDSVLYDETLKKTKSEKSHLENSQAMEESSNLDMISSNLHFMAWTAVAALAVGAGIKASR